jgi:hypothetical protein
MKRKLCAWAVVFTLALFFTNAFTIKADEGPMYLNYVGTGDNWCWDSESVPCDNPYPDGTPVNNIDCNKDFPIRQYTYSLSIFIAGNNVFGDIEITKTTPDWCRPSPGPAYFGIFQIEKGRVEGNTISFTVVAQPPNPDPGEYSLFTFTLAEMDENTNEFNGGFHLEGGAIQPGENDFDEFMYVEFEPSP